MTERRNFNQAERAAIFIASGGFCQICSIELDDTWEADHIVPFSKGGETSILNGQALCQKCNREKQDKILTNKITLRPFQQEFVDKAIQKALSGQNTLVAHAAAGSGKTLASQSAADALLSRGIVDQVVVLVPRLNLAHQYELDWQEMCGALAWQPTMRKILHRANSFQRLIPRSADGYVTTYQSLCANPQKHIKAVASKKTVLILDEAQQLGYDEFGRDTSQSARWVEELGNHAAFIIVMSGTPYRSDNKPLLFANYSDDDGTGYRVLIPDLEATYRDGVRERYLRRFEYRLADGGYTWNDISGQETEYTLSDEEASVYHALQLAEIWQPLTDTFVDVLDDQKKHNNRFCGLVACLSQKQANDVKSYLEKTHPSLRILKATSEDGEAAHKALRDFKTGKYDVLVTVSMAYVGYDYKWINTVLLLTPIRSRAYLMQLVARGLRVISSIDYDKQSCYIIAPDDPKMREFVEFMRGESDAGYKQRENLIADDFGKVDKEKQGHELGYASNAFISELRALGIDPNSDLTPEELRIAEQIKRVNNYPFSVTDMMSIYRSFSEAFKGMAFNTVTIDRPRQTHAEKLKEARTYIDELCGQFALQLNDGVYIQHIIGKLKTQVRTRLNKAYGVGSVNQIDDIEELRNMWSTLARWKEQGYIDDRR